MGYYHPAPKISYGRLTTAACLNDIKGVAYLLEQGVDINELDSNYSALHWAVYNNNKEMVRLLIDKGANLNIKSHFDKTPYHWARDYGYSEIAQILKDAEKIRKQQERKIKERALQEKKVLKSGDFTEKNISLTKEFLSAIVERGNTKQLRDFFNKAFWEHKKIQPDWSHLKAAMQREDKSMMRLLITWGAKPDNRELTRLDVRHLALLRQCGLPIKRPAATPFP